MYFSFLHTIWFVSPSCLLCQETPIFFTGEMVYPFMFDEEDGFPFLKPLREAAQTGWARNYSSAGQVKIFECFSTSRHCKLSLHVVVWVWLDLHPTKADGCEIPHSLVPPAGSEERLGPAVWPGLTGSRHCPGPIPWCFSQIASNRNCCCVQTFSYLRNWAFRVKVNPPSIATNCLLVSSLSAAFASCTHSTTLL